MCRNSWTRPDHGLHLCRLILCNSKWADMYGRCGRIPVMRRSHSMWPAFLDVINTHLLKALSACGVHVAQAGRIFLFFYLFYFLLACWKRFGGKCGSGTNLGDLAPGFFLSQIHSDLVSWNSNRAQTAIINFSLMIHIPTVGSPWLVKVPLVLLQARVQWTCVFLRRDWQQS